MAPSLDTRLQKKRDQILDAAAAAFADDGYEATSMDRIADRAGASKRTVYNHFESKEVLFRAVAERLFQQVRALKRQAWDPDRDIAEQLAGFAEAKAFIASDPAWAKLMRVMLGVFVRYPEMAESITAEVAGGENDLVRWLEAADGAGALAVPEPARAAEIFWALASGMLFWPQVLERPLSKAAKARAIDDVVQTFLSRYRPR